MISRIILGDNYLELKNLYKNEYYDNLDLEKELEENDNFDVVNNIILEYIENCIEDNTFTLPNDETLRLEIYSNFIDYNMYIKNHINDYIELNKNKENIKKLNKINPTSILNIIYKN